MSMVPFPLFVAVTVALGAIKVVRLAAIEISVFPPITVWSYETPPAVIVTTSVTAGVPVRVILITLSVVWVAVEVNGTPATLAVTSTDPKPPIFAEALTTVDDPLILFVRFTAISLIDWSELPSELRSFVVSE